MEKKLFNIISGVSFAICFVYIFLICSFENIKEQGLEEWSPNTSSLSLGHYQFPSEDYLEISEYIGGDYFYTYQDEVFGEDLRETSFVYLVYDEETYETEKQYIFDNMPLSTCSFSYNGYIFYENLMRQIHHAQIEEYSIPFNPLDYPEMEKYMTEQGTSRLFPYQDSTIFGYNDEKRTLLFFFLCAYGEQEELAKSLIEEGWDVFLKEFFPYYDFDS